MRFLKSATSPTLLSTWEQSISTRVMTYMFVISLRLFSSIACLWMKAVLPGVKTSSFPRERKSRTLFFASWSGALLESLTTSSRWRSTSTPEKKTFGMKMSWSSRLSSKILSIECLVTSSSRASTAFIWSFKIGTRNNKNYRDQLAQWWKRWK